MQTNVDVELDRRRVAGDGRRPQRVAAIDQGPRRSRATRAFRARTPRSRRTTQAHLLLAVILIVAAVTRVWGARYGFPLLLHPDEWAVVDAVIDMAERNSFEPPWSLRPDHVEMKVDYVVFAAYAALVKGTSIEAAFAADPVPFYYLARLVTAAFGIATVGLAYLVGARWSRRVGLVAAALFALFPPFVLHAHYATPDVPLTFAVMLLIYALMRYLDSPSWPNLLLACFAVALAVAIKYPGAVGTLMIGLVVVVAGVRDREWRRLVVQGVGSAIASLAFLFVISPTLFTNVSGIRRELEIQSAGSRLGHPDLGLLGNMEYYASAFLSSSGVVLASLSLVGVAVAVRRRRLDTLPWLTGVLIWVSLSTLPMTWERWGLPMWVTPILFGAVGMCVLFEKLKSPRTRWIPVLAALIVGLHLAIGTARVVASLVVPDTRGEALTWADDEGVRPDNTIFEGYTPFLPGTSRLFFDQVRPDGDGYAFSTTTGEPARYVVLSSGMYQRVMADPKYAEQQQVYRYIFDNFDEIATFEPMANAQPAKLEPFSMVRNLSFVRAAIDGSRSGPVIRVFEVPPAGAIPD